MRRQLASSLEDLVILYRRPREETVPLLALDAAVPGVMPRTAEATL